MRQAACLSPPTASDSGSGAAVYAAYVTAQVASQEERKHSFEQRGLAVITTSGVLVSLLFGLTATLTSVAGYHLPHASRGWILAALVCFVAAAVAAILTNLPLKYSGVTADALKKTIDERWQDSAADAQREVALTEVKVIRRAKKRNRWKGWALVFAIASEIAAVLCLAVAVAVILYG
jgi:amino acid transporter